MKRLVKILRMLRDEQGIGLVVILCLSAVLIMAGLSFTWMTGNSAHVVRKLEKGVSALAVAEAGIAHALWMLEDDYYTYYSGATITGAVGRGVYTVHTTLNTLNGFVLVESKGVVGDDERETVLELLGNLYEIWDDVVGMDGVIVAGGDIQIDSSACSINGDIMANGDVVCSSGLPEINGDISAQGTITGITADEDHTNYPDAPPISVPNLLYGDAPEDWLALATNGGLYFTNSVEWSGDTIVSPNGVIWVEGDVHIGHGAATTMHGTLVVNGSITVDNRFDAQVTNTNWPLMIASQDINLNNRNVYDGIIWAGNNIVTLNNRECTGAFIAMNNVQVKNQVDLYPPFCWPAWAPDDTNDNKAKVVLGGWLK